MKLYIVAANEEDTKLAVTSGFGWSDKDAARAQLKEIIKEMPNTKLRIYEVTINVKEIK